MKSTADKQRILPVKQMRQCCNIVTFSVHCRALAIQQSKCLVERNKTTAWFGHLAHKAFMVIRQAQQAQHTRRVHIFDAMHQVQQALAVVCAKHRTDH